MEQINAYYDGTDGTAKIVVCFAAKVSDSVEQNGIAGWHVQVEIRAREQSADSILEAFRQAGDLALKEIEDLTFESLSQAAG